MLYVVESANNINLESAFFETKSAISSAVHEYEMSVMNEKYNFLCENGHEMAVYQVKEKKENFFMKAIHFIVKKIKEFWSLITKPFRALAAKLKKKKGCEEAANDVLAIADGMDNDYKASEQKILALNPGNGAIPMGPASDYDENIKKAQAEANSFVDKTKKNADKASRRIKKAIENAKKAGLDDDDLDKLMADAEKLSMSGNQVEGVVKSIKAGIPYDQINPKASPKEMKNQRKSIINSKVVKESTEIDDTYFEIPIV